MTRFMIILFLFVGALSLVFALSIPTEEPLSLVTGYEENPPLKLVPVEGRVYHAMSPDVFTGWTGRSSMSLVEDTRRIAGKGLSWVSVSNTWFPKTGAPGCAESRLRPFDPGIRFPRRDVDTALRAGELPSIRMLPYDRCISSDFADYKLQTFIDGEHDEALREWALEAKATPSPLLVTFGVEVNGDWFPWNMKHNGGYQKTEYGSPGLYDGHERFRDAYRHIIDLFRDEGVENVTWFYHVNCIWPSEIDDAASSVDGYYPGDEYIDWIAISCYGSQDARNPFWWDMSFTFDNSYELLENSSVIGKDKPIALMEFGVTEDPRKAGWISAFLTDLEEGAYPRIRAMGWWQSEFCVEYGNMTCNAYADIRVESSPESLEVYRRHVRKDFYISEPVFR